MTTYTVRYTKVFAPDSTLAGLEYPEVETGLSMAQADRVWEWAQAHEAKPVKAYGSSNYTVANCTVEPSN